MDANLTLGVISALSLGFVSSLHCVGMCGGIMGALTMSIPAEARAKRWAFIGAYNLGRVLTYALLGALFGAMLSTMPSASMVLRWVAGALLIAMGLYLANWWRGLVALEQGGRYLWAYLQPLSKPLLPVNRLHKAAILGAIWGMLPCGLVYSALAFAATFQNAEAAALVMAAFGLGTLPAVFATGVAAQTLQRLAQRTGLRYAMAVLVVAFGIWTIAAASPLMHGHHGEHHGQNHGEHHGAHHGAQHGDSAADHSHDPMHDPIHPPIHQTSQPTSHQSDSDREHQADDHAGHH